MARKKAPNPFVAGIRGLTGGEPRVSNKELREALDVRRKSKKPVAQTGATISAPKRGGWQRGWEALERAGVPRGITQEAIAIDRDLLGLDATAQSLHNILGTWNKRAEPGAEDYLNVALATPIGGLAFKPVEKGLAVLGRGAKRLASKGMDTAVGRYLTEARPLVGAVDEAINPATLNIGLEPSTKIGGSAISEQEALSAIRSMGRDPQNFRVVPSSSEPTLVADIEPPLSAREVYDLSEQLRQDAIAQRLPAQGDEAGLLAGPRAEDFGGEFSPGYFFLQGGDTIGAEKLTEQFRAGAPVEDILATADRWGFPLDPVNLAVNVRMRDELSARGELPSGFGVFTGRSVARDPEALRALQAGEGPVNFEGLRVGPQPELQGVDARGVHISRAPGLSQLDPAMFGRGHQGEEYRTVKQMGLPKRSYMYSGPEGTIAPEPAVLGVEGDKMVRGPRYAYEGSLQNLYDIDADPEQLNAMAQLMGGWPDMERWVQQRGYAGYLTDQGPSWDRKSRRAAALYGPTDVAPIDPEPIADWRRKFAVGGRV